MDNIQKRYGYTGQGLRVNLTTGKITILDSKRLETLQRS